MDLDCSKPDQGLRKFRGAEAEKEALKRDEFGMSPAFRCHSGLACSHDVHLWQPVERVQTIKANQLFQGAVILPACQVDRNC